jgi:hypothetical protein
MSTLQNRLSSKEDKVSNLRHKSQKFANKKARSYNNYRYALPFPFPPKASYAGAAGIVSFVIPLVVVHVPDRAVESTRLAGAEQAPS